MCRCASLQEGAPGKLPTVLVRTPCDRMENQVYFAWTGLFLKHGYAGVVQIEPGRIFREEASITIFRRPARTVTKRLMQLRSNGKVGRPAGRSSSRETQWPLVVSNHAGHAAMIPDISSSSFPMYERNLNTGGNNYDESKWVVAENRGHYGAQHPSQIVVPVLLD